VVDPPPHMSKPILRLNYFSNTVPYVSQIKEPLSNMLVNKTWTPCSVSNDDGSITSESGSSIGGSSSSNRRLGRVIYDDSRIGLWVVGEATWWRLDAWTKTNINGNGGVGTDLSLPWPKPTHASSSLGGVARRTSFSISPKGHYAQRGLLYECPAGHFGNRLGQHEPTCSGCCEKGYYCPPSSINQRQIPCGGTDRYCPPCSASPQPVLKGYYTSTIETEACPPGTWRNISLLFDPTLNPSTNLQSEMNSGSFSTSVAHDTYWRMKGKSGGGDDDGNVNSASSGKGDGSGDGWAIGPLPPCVLCPQGKFKAITGDEYELCLECDEPTTGGGSSYDRVSCECLRAPGGDTFEALRFVPETGACEAVRGGGSCVLLDCCWIE
jgi:hypothetical protein